MALFQTKKIQSFIVFIIVLVAILWLFQDNILKISVLQKTTEQLDSSNQESKEAAYLEKIDNFIIKEYSKDQDLTCILLRLRHTIVIKIPQFNF